MKCLLRVAAAGAAALTVLSTAHAETIDLGEVVITPNRSETGKAKVGSTVNVIGKEDIERQSLPSLQEYLAQVPGVSVSSSGGPGQNTSLIMRGADKKYVKTLFDGIDISDSAEPQVQTAFDQLQAANVQSVEVLKGSQSTLYGSEAVAGVISISTLGDFDDGIRYIVGGEAGSFGTWRGRLGMQGAADGSRVAVSVLGLSTDGISAADARNGNTEEDAYRNLTVTFSGEKKLDDELTAFASALYIQSKAQFDNGGAAPSDNPFNHAPRRQWAGRAGLRHDTLDGRMHNAVSVQVNQIKRQSNTVDPFFGPFSIAFLGMRQKADWVGSYEVNDAVTVQAGADYERLEFDNGFSGNQTWIAGQWGQIILSPLEGLTLTGAVRHDQHQDFGGYTTWRATAAYNFAETGTRIRGSAGTGFRAPSPYELGYVSFLTGTNNPGLKPEQSLSWDAGIDQTLLDGALTASVTYFVLDTDNLIDYDFGGDAYVQVPGKTRRSGVEVSANWTIAAWADLAAAYTYTRAVDAAGMRRPRVPKHDLHLGLVTRPAENWTVSATARIVQDTVDTVGGSLSALDDYVLVGAKVGYSPMPGLEVYVRGDNLLDQKYQTVRGYGTPGAAVYGGFNLIY